MVVPSRPFLFIFPTAENSSSRTPRIPHSSLSNDKSIKANTPPKKKKKKREEGGYVH
jgi:hypothetical protein